MHWITNLESAVCGTRNFECFLCISFGDSRLRQGAYDISASVSFIHLGGQRPALIHNKKKKKLLSTECVYRPRRPSQIISAINAGTLVRLLHCLFWIPKKSLQFQQIIKPFPKCLFFAAYRGFFLSTCFKLQYRLLRIFIFREQRRVGFQGHRGLNTIYTQYIQASQQKQFSKVWIEQGYQTSLFIEKGGGGGNLFSNLHLVHD